MKSGPTGRNGGADDGKSEEEEMTESDYDWESEATKDERHKGLQFKLFWFLGPVEFRIRRMIWERRDGRWCGRWTWGEWEDRDAWLECTEASRERVIAAWDAADVPAEVLLRFLESLVGSGPSVIREDSINQNVKATGLEGLGNVALICRAWYTIVAPTLYSKLKIRDSVPGTPLRQSVGNYTKRIWILGDRPMVTSARVVRQSHCPSPAVWLLLGDFEGQAPSPKDDAGYHPRHAIIYSQLHRTYSRVVALDLCNCRFHSSSDLMRLLASFPTLEQTTLARIIIAHVSQSVVQPRRSSTSLLWSIKAYHMCDPLDLRFVTQCWTWPHRPCTRPEPVFHGLHLAEQRSAAHVIKLVGLPDPHYHLDIMGCSCVTCKQHTFRSGAIHSRY